MLRERKTMDAQESLASLSHEKRKASSDGIATLHCAMDNLRVR